MEWPSLAASPPFWTAVSAFMAAMVSGYVTLRAGRRAALAAERKDTSAAGKDAQDTLNSSFKLFTEEVRQALASEREARAAERDQYRLERAELMKLIKSLRGRVNVAINHIGALERAIKSAGQVPPDRPQDMEEIID